MLGPTEWILIALIIITSAAAIGSADTGGIGSLWDGISLAIVLLPAYFLTAAASNSYGFINDKKSVILFGNLALGFGFVGVMFGLIFTLAGMTIPPPSGVDPTIVLVSNLAIASPIFPNSWKALPRL